MSLATYGDYAARTRESFARQPAMRAMGISMDDVAPGEVWLSMPFNPDFTQQHGFMHAGAIISGLDTAAGFAAYSVMPEEAGVLTVELKTSLMRPGKGQRFNFHARVLKPGRTILFTEAVATAIDGAKEHEIARLTATMMAVQGRDDVQG
ncbi:PaaI family thioesterase [Aquicoccus porphyridii]|uniref:PaaI family thioesterase n=1 Tax=Aquicoccus porphyridii TaxID=1852029 RepID=UPI00273F6DFA|nr:PaaI family thioesterase [Aquicoccus porphyridii]